MNHPRRIARSTSVVVATLFFALPFGLALFEWQPKQVFAIAVANWGLLLVWTTLSCLVAWRAYSDALAVYQRPFRRLCRPLVEGAVIAAVVYFAVDMTGTFYELGHDRFRPRNPLEWTSALQITATSAVVAAGLGAATGAILGLVNRLTLYYLLRRNRSLRDTHA